MKYARYAALIRAAGKIMHYMKLKQLITPMKIFADQTIEILNQTKVIEPVLLTAVCQLCYRIMTNKFVLRSKDKIKEISDKHNNLKELFQYLGGKKYKGLCQLTNFY